MEKDKKEKVLGSRGSFNFTRGGQGRPPGGGVWGGEEGNCLDIRGKSIWHWAGTKEEIPRQECLECKRTAGGPCAWSTVTKERGLDHVGPAWPLNQLWSHGRLLQRTDMLQIRLEKPLVVDLLPYVPMADAGRAVRSCCSNQGRKADGQSGKLWTHWEITYFWAQRFGYEVQERMRQGWHYSLGPGKQAGQNVPSVDTRATVSRGG